MVKEKSRILIVDDSMEQIDLLTEMLIGKYDIICAFNGNRALELARETPQPDLILLDIIMPEPDGYQVCQILKEDNSTSHIPIILTTGLSGLRNESNGLNAGAVDYIQKPYNGELIHARIKNHLESKLQKDSLEVVVKDRTKELKMTQALLIEGLGILAEYRDPETGGHIKRTQSFVNALAKALREDSSFEESLSDLDIELLHQSAPLHDIGKIGVPDSILLKPGKLTENEFQTMKIHPELGHQMLSRTMEKLPNKSFFRYALEIAYSHHEKWDGTGYPLGLKGKEIPLSGRLMALADVYDALVNNRYYKDALSHEEAKKIIIRQSGKHFDPQIVMAFLKIEDIFFSISRTYSDEDYTYEESPGGSNKQIRHILLADDNEINLEIMKNQLKSLGYIADIAANGREALELMRAMPIDAVITDLDMPEINGYELCRIIETEYPDVPVIATTSSDYRLNRSNMRSHGFSGFLLKPFDDQMVRNLLNNLSSD